jgi:octaprenyl-diphosphate synthase
VSAAVGSRDSPYERILGLLRNDLDSTTEVILSRIRSRAALIPQLTTYLVDAGGKRLRPLLTLASARLCGYQGTRHHSLAACVEFIHTATLLHDDVVDESETRRGRRSANAVFGNDASVLVGDYLFSRAFELMVADGNLEVLRILSSASVTIAEGEVLQLSVSNDLSTSEEAHLEIIRCKTAALFAAACEVGAVLAERPEAQSALQAYGMNLGMAFQLADDVLDYSATQTLGKDIGDDFRGGKVTLPVLLAFQRGDAEERAFWQRTISQRASREGDLAQAQRLLENGGALSDTLARARRYAETARNALSGVPDSDFKESMRALADFVVDRNY